MCRSPTPPAPAVRRADDGVGPDGELGAAQRGAPLAQLEHRILEHDGQVPLPRLQRPDAHVALQHRHGELRPLLPVRHQLRARAPLLRGHPRRDLARLAVVARDARAHRGGGDHQQRDQRDGSPEEQRVLPPEARAPRSRFVHRSVRMPLPG
jgi:hypothetical protein